MIHATTKKKEIRETGHYAKSIVVIFAISLLFEKTGIFPPVLALLSVSCCESPGFHSEKKVTLTLFILHRRIDNLDPK